MFNNYITSCLSIAIEEHLCKNVEVLLLLYHSSKDLALAYYHVLQCHLAYVSCTVVLGTSCMCHGSLVKRLYTPVP